MPHTLVLLDELGAGTDPAEGAALAVAIIEELRRRGVLLMATTHYAELKVFALETKGVVNASCEFDLETLCPTYKLSVGVPGNPTRSSSVKSWASRSGSLKLHSSIFRRRISVWMPFWASWTI